AVFSAGYPAYYERVLDGVKYFISGCGGGLLLNEEKERYQYLRVNVGRDKVTYENMDVPHRLGPLLYKMETLEFFLHSVFYVGFFNFLLILSIIGIIALKVYSLIIRQETYYRDFSIDEKLILEKPIRVAMFTNNYLPFLGGVPISIYRLYQGLIGMGSAVKIFAPSYQQGTSEGKDEDIFRCSTYLIGKDKNVPITNIFSRKIDKVFKAFNCDLVHVHHPFWLGKKGMRLAKRYEVPIVFTYHTRLERYTHYIPIPGAILKNLVAHYMVKHFANKCDAIITPTSSTEEYLRHLGVSSIVETIPTGINTREYGQWSDREISQFRSRYASGDELLLLSVSRMAREKNLDFLIDGLKKVYERTKTPFRCLLVGDGPEKARLEEKVTGLGLGERIIFAGGMDPHQVVGYYLASDLFVFASTSETQGMVLVEAMAGGCPVVAVSASGVYDVIEDGLNGYKVPESTDNWAEAIITLLEDQETLRRLSENSRRFAEKYSVESITEKVLRLYARVLVLRKVTKRGL
ncbi:MAG: glycosyltransferase, partial [bacterium]